MGMESHLTRTIASLRSRDALSVTSYPEIIEMAFSRLKKSKMRHLKQQLGQYLTLMALLIVVQVIIVLVGIACDAYLLSLFVPEDYESNIYFLSFCFGSCLLLIGAILATLALTFPLEKVSLKRRGIRKQLRQLKETHLDPESVHELGLLCFKWQIKSQESKFPFKEELAEKYACHH